MDQGGWRFSPFGEGVWLRASIPLQYFVGMDKSGNDLASTINRRTNSFWMSVWGPFGELKSRAGGRVCHAVPDQRRDGGDTVGSSVEKG